MPYTIPAVLPWVGVVYKFWYSVCISPFSSKMQRGFRVRIWIHCSWKVCRNRRTKSGTMTWRALYSAFCNCISSEMLTSYENLFKNIFSFKGPENDFLLEQFILSFTSKSLSDMFSCHEECDSHERLECLCFEVAFRQLCFAISSTDTK